MTEKELRKHIKPYLRLAIKYYSQLIKQPICRDALGLCEIADIYYTKETDHTWYRIDHEIPNYIRARLNACRPDTCYISGLWWDLTDIAYHPNIDGIQKRIDFCKLQLKIVKP